MTTPSRLFALAVLLAAAPGALAAQQREVPGFQRAGPLITAGGMSVAVEDPTFVIPAGHVFKGVFVIDEGDTTSVNEQLQTVARFLNLHARHGIPTDRLKAAAVVHGTGWRALLSDSAFGARYGGRVNPSRALVEDLLAHGVPLVLCGQTAAFRGVRREELLPGVQLAISAMTALNVFQADGYRYNPW